MGGGSSGPAVRGGAAIDIRGLTKFYGRHRALDGLDLDVEPGQIFGFLGPNGAGKSTTIRLLLDLIRPSAGSARILGFDCRRQSHEVRARVGYLPGDLRFAPGHTGRDTLRYFAGLRGCDPADPALESFRDRLDLDLDRQVGALSKGMRQKLGVLLALVGRPSVLLMDEPTSGLDPIMQHVVWETLKEVAAAGATVFLSSHVMSEVERVCDRVAILREGRLVAADSVQALLARAGRRVEVVFAGSPPARLEAGGVREIGRNEHSVVFEVAGEFDPLVKALAGHHVAELRTEQVTLDDVLMSYYREDRP